MWPQDQDPKVSFHEFLILEILFQALWVSSFLHDFFSLTHLVSIVLDSLWAAYKFVISYVSYRESCLRSWIRGALDVIVFPWRSRGQEKNSKSSSCLSINSKYLRMIIFILNNRSVEVRRHISSGTMGKWKLVLSELVF